MEISNYIKQDIFLMNVMQKVSTMLELAVIKLENDREKNIKSGKNDTKDDISFNVLYHIIAELEMLKEEDFIEDSLGGVKTAKKLLKQYKTHKVIDEVYAKQIEKRMTSKDKALYEEACVEMSSISMRLEASAMIQEHINQDHFKNIDTHLFCRTVLEITERAMILIEKYIEEEKNVVITVAEREWFELIGKISFASNLFLNEKHEADLDDAFIASFIEQLFKTEEERQAFSFISIEAFESTPE